MGRDGSESADEDIPAVSPRKTWPSREFRQARRRLMRRCGGRCEWKMPGLNLRCHHEATTMWQINVGDDHSLTNLEALCAHHYAVKKAEERERARFVAIRVRPPKSDVA